MMLIAKIDSLFLKKKRMLTVQRFRECQKFLQYTIENNDETYEESDDYGYNYSVFISSQKIVLYMISYMYFYDENTGETIKQTYNDTYDELNKLFKVSDDGHQMNAEDIIFGDTKIYYPPRCKDAWIFSCIANCNITNETKFYINSDYIVFERLGGSVMYIDKKSFIVVPFDSCTFVYESRNDMMKPTFTYYMSGHYYLTDRLKYDFVMSKRQINDDTTILVHNKSDDIYDTIQKVWREYIKKVCRINRGAPTDITVICPE